LCCGGSEDFQKEVFDFFCKKLGSELVEEQKQKKLRAAFLTISNTVSPTESTSNLKPCNYITWNTRGSTMKKRHGTTFKKL